MKKFSKTNVKKGLCYDIAELYKIKKPAANIASACGDFSVNCSVHLQLSNTRAALLEMELLYSRTVISCIGKVIF